MTTRSPAFHPIQHQGVQWPPQSSHFEPYTMTWMYNDHRNGSIQRIQHHGVQWPRQSSHSPDYRLPGCRLTIRSLIDLIRWTYNRVSQWPPQSSHSPDTTIRISNDHRSPAIHPIQQHGVQWRPQSSHSPDSGVGEVHMTTTAVKPFTK